MPEIVFAAVMLFLALLFAEYALGMVDLVAYIFLSGLSVYFILLYLIWRMHVMEQRLAGTDTKKK
jgi:hypothetical protein